MPRARKTAPPAEVTASSAPDIETPEDVLQTIPGGLRFDQALTWRAGRPISVSDLLSRLEALSEELGEIDQEEAHRDSLTPKAQELANAQLLAHKDKGVRAWTLLCIVKMFHLLAPDAPYKARQLQDIFTLFATQVIPAFADMSDPYIQQYMDILTAFANDKSILLILDIPSSDDLMLQIFRTAFDTMAGKSKDVMEDNIPKNVEYQLTAVLTDIVAEAEILPNPVVDVVLAQFLRADTSVPGVDADLGASPAYDMARAICNSSAANMSRYVNTYFSSVLLNVSEVSSSPAAKRRSKKRKHNEEAEDDDDVDAADVSNVSVPSADSLDDVVKAHRLLRELWRSTPDIVQGVIPQIEIGLGDTNTQMRLLAVQTIGDLIAGVGSAGLFMSSTLDPAAWPPQALQLQRGSSERRYMAPKHFSKAYAECYQAFLDRYKDKSNVIRSAWAKSVGRIIATSAGGKGLDSEDEASLLRSLKILLADSDEKVRLAVIEGLAVIDYFTLIALFSRDAADATSVTLLDTLADRVKDRGPPVRIAAITFLAKLWGVASAAIPQDASISDLVGAIPTKLLAARYLNQPDVNYHIPLALHEYLLPISFPPIKNPIVPDSQQTDGQLKAVVVPDAIRAERILVLLSSLDERAEKVFTGLQTQQIAKAKYLSMFVDQCELVNENKKSQEAKDKLDKLIQVMARDMLDAEVATQHLKQIAKHNDKRNHQLTRFCLAPESDYRKVFKAMKELQKRIESAPPQVQATLETIFPLLKSAAILIYNRSHVSTFMTFARTDDKGLGNAAKKILEHIAAMSSEVFKIHATELCQTLQSSQPSRTQPSDSLLSSSLKTCVNFARHQPGGMPKSRDFYKAMTAYALYAGDPLSAKCAISIIAAAAEKKEMYISDILSQCVKEYEYGQSFFTSRLAAIAQIQLLAHQQTIPWADQIMSVAVTQTLRASEESPVEDSLEWIERDQHDEHITAKLLAIKVLVNGLRGQDQTDGDSTELRSTAQPVFKLLNTIIEREGDLQNLNLPKHYRSQLRLAAGIGLLKLCCSRNLNSLLSEIDFNRLCKLCQDPLPEVRSRFSKAVTKYLGRGKLSSRFYALLFLYAHEPVPSIKVSIGNWIRARKAATSDESAGKPSTVMENIFARLLSLLAHHPDFSYEIEDLSETVGYIMFYLTNVATQTNLPILYNIAQQLKTVCDAVSKDNSDSLYAVADLGEATIRAFHEEKGWILQTLSEKVRLPPSVAAALPADMDAQELAEKRFIPDTMIDEIPELVRAGLRQRRKRTDRVSAPKKTRDAVVTSVRSHKPRANNGTARKRSSDSETPEPKPSKRSRSSQHTESNDGATRRSSRGAAGKQYVEMDSDADDEELERWNDVDDDKENDEEMLEDTPPTSDFNPTGTQSSTALQITPPKEQTRNKSRLVKDKPTSVVASTRTSGRLAKASGDS